MSHRSLTYIFVKTYSFVARQQGSNRKEHIHHFIPQYSVIPLMSATLLSSHGHEVKISWLSSVLLQS